MSKSKEVKLLRLISGEELLASVEEKEHHFVLYKPIAFQITPPKPGTQQIGLNVMPWPQFADPNSLKNSGISIHKAHVVFCVDAVSQLVEQYAQVTGGIVPVKAPSLIMP